MRISRAIIIGALLAGPALAQDDRKPPFTISETGQAFWRIDDALQAAGDRNATILIAPGSYRQCGVQNAGKIHFKAEVPGRAIFDGVACEGKAALVLRGRGATVEGLVFQNITVEDENGAGIRLERGDLAVINSLFRNSQQGILTASDPGATITIDHSTFSGLGYCPEGGSCAHSIYVGEFGTLKVRRSRFEKGTGGHYVKSRAPHVEITDSSFDDSHGRATNYMIDLPQGAVGSILRNTFVQGRDKENYSAFIAIAAEGRDHRSAGLVIDGNAASLAPGVDRKTTFVADWSHEPLRLGTNRLGAGLKAFETR